VFYTKVFNSLAETVGDLDAKIVNKMQIDLTNFAYDRG
jgi:hypothetical protein